MLGFDKKSKENDLKVFLWKKLKKKKSPNPCVSGSTWNIPKAALNFYGLWHFLFVNIPNAIYVNLVELFTAGWYSQCAIVLKRDHLLIAGKSFRAGLTPLMLRCGLTKWRQDRDADLLVANLQPSKAVLPKQILQKLLDILQFCRENYKPEIISNMFRRFLWDLLVCFVWGVLFVCFYEQVLLHVCMPVPYNYAP